MNNPTDKPSKYVYSPLFWKIAQAPQNPWQQPCHGSQKNEEELFIEGNLIKAQKSLAENQQAGDKYAGTIPRSRQLCQLSATDTLSNTLSKLTNPIDPKAENTRWQMLKKGVMAYAVGDDSDNHGVMMSNGKHLLWLNDGQEQVVGEHKWVNKISLL